MIFGLLFSSMTYAHFDHKKPKDKEKKQTDTLAQQVPCDHGDTLTQLYNTILDIKLRQDSVFNYKQMNTKLEAENILLLQDKTSLKTENTSLKTTIKSLESSKSVLLTDKQLAETSLSVIQVGLSNQVNAILISLKAANYSTNSAIINNLIEIVKLSNNAVMVSQLEEFKLKSSAIQLAMNEINSPKILTESQVKSLLTNLESAYSVNNPNFEQLANDYKQCLDLLSKYSTYLCDLYYAFNTVVVDLRAGNIEMKEDVIKDYAFQMRGYPTFVNLIQKVINDKFVSNPLEGKVKCD